MVDKPSTLTPPTGHPIVVPGQPRPPLDARSLKLAPERTSVCRARDHALDVLPAAGVQEEGVVGDVRLLVSEAITNAIRAAARFAVQRGQPWKVYELPVGLRIACRPDWVHLLVTDPDPQEPQPEERVLLDEDGGRSFTSIDHTAALWWFSTGTYSKTLHIIVPRWGRSLTDDEVNRLRQRVIL